MQTTSGQTRGAVIVGAILVGIGALLLVAQFTDLRLDFLTWPIVIGFALFLLGVGLGGERGTGFAGFGGLVFMLGVVLYAQRELGGFVSWFYAWALVAPGGVGLGLTAYGIVTWRAKTFRDGMGGLMAGIVLFLIGLVLVEGVWNLNGRADMDLVSYAAPLAIVAIGIAVLLGAFVWPYFFPDPDLTGASWSSAGAPGGGAAAGAVAGGAAAGAAAGASQAGSDAVTAAIPLGAARTADVVLNFGAGTLRIVGPAAPGNLLDGSFRGGVKREDGGVGQVTLTTPGERIWNTAWDRAPFEWTLGLTAEVPLRLTVKTGASKTEADLSGLRMTELRVQTGAADTAVTLPAAAGVTRVFAEGGAAALKFRVPAGVAARIRSTMALGSTDVDATRFPRDAQGGWTSPDFETAEHKVELELRGGVGSITVR